MMIDHLPFLLPVIFLAYFCKATTGFGAAIIMLAVGSIIVGPVPALMLTSVLDVVGGFALLRLDTTEDSRKLWVPLSFVMVLGVAIGSLFLRHLAYGQINLVMGVSLLAAGVWLMVIRPRQRPSPVTDCLPQACHGTDLAVCLFAGLSGGMTGLSGPPLVFHFGRKLPKEALRRILTRIFLAESLARLVAFMALGLLQPRFMINCLLAIPFMYFGLYMGNHAFFRIPQVWFCRLAGSVIIASALRLIW
jgi:uncharacterized membrane protein YfcA